VASPASTAPRSGEGGADHAPHAGSAAKPHGEILAITQRDDFLLELGDALAGQFTLTPADTLSAALEQLTPGRRLQLLAIDTRSTTDLRGDVDRAHAHAGAVPVVVFAAAESDKSIAAALKGSSVFAVLPIPIDRRKTNAVFEGAFADATQRRSSARAAERGAERPVEARMPLVVEPAPAAPIAAAEPPRSLARKPALWAIVALVLLGAGFAAWKFTASKPSTGTAQLTPAPESAAAAPSAASSSKSAAAAARPAVSPTASADIPLVKGSADDLLEKARQAMRERRFAEPANDSALLYYRSALAAEPANAEAHDGMTRLASLLLARFEESLTAAHYEDASGALAGLKLALPGDARIGSMEARLLSAEITRDFSDGNLEHVPALIRQAQQANAASAEQLSRWRAELARRQDDAHYKHFADLMNERIRDGHLDEPENDSAKFYLQQLRDLGSANPAVARAAHDLVVAYLHKARDAAVAGHASEADHWQSVAKTAGATPADLTAYQHDVAGARQKAAAAEADRFAQLARERLRDGHLTDPTSDSATYYLGQLRDASPDHAALAGLGRELAAQLIERATSEARAGLAVQMASDLTLAKRWGAQSSDVQAVEQLAATRGGAGSPSRAAGGAGSLADVKLKRVRYVAPEYPDSALDKRIAGYVTVEFIVGIDGVPRNVRVADAQPKGVFDKSAKDAISRWRFEPLPQEVPTHETIRFALPK